MSMSVVLTGIVLVCIGAALLQEVNTLFAQERQYYHRHYKRDLLLVDVIVVILYGLTAALVGLIYVFFGNEPLVIYGALAVFGVAETVLVARHCPRCGSSANRLGIVLLLIWLGVVLYLTLFSRLGGEAGSKVMSTPFLGLSQALEQRSLEPLGHFALNMLLFMPLGCLLPSIFPEHLRRAGFAVLGGLLLSTMIEGIQMLAKLGYCDIDDMIANTLGTAFGYLIYRLGRQIQKNWQI